MARSPRRPNHLVTSHALMRYSKQPQAAKDFLKWLHSKEQFGLWFETDYGFQLGATTHWEKHPMWDRIEEAMRPYRSAARKTRMIGHAGPANARATEVYSKYIVTDMFARAAKGEKPEDSVRWAEGELRRIYEA